MISEKIVEKTIDDAIALFRESELNAIYSRRAVRSYSHQRVSSELVDKLIDAAIQAPSAMNSQPWGFVVIQNQELIHELSVKVTSDFDVFYEATTLIIVYAKKDGFEPVGDCYLAIQNLMLAATALGLGTCPIGYARETLKSEEWRQKLSIPSDYVPVLPIVVGYTQDVPTKSDRSPPQIFKWIK
ncbi:MAG: nitroreductase [Xanthomonadaceae bacterium]|nr:nitroreductase [Xanthomonadaceae bacterium]